MAFLRGRRVRHNGISRLVRPSAFAGATLRFLPPYSPDFNPIEKAFLRLMAMLRKAGERTVRSLWDLIGKLVHIFQPNECANYFRSHGYEPE